MCEILKENLSTEFSNIKNKFENAEFFAIDCEFSGLLLNEKTRHFDRDSIQERYSKILGYMHEFIIIQIGITAFEFRAECNAYEGHTFTFYTFPESFGMMNVYFNCQVSAFQFLRQYKFDFNKLIYHGVPYLSHEQDKILRSIMSSEEFLLILQNSSSIEEKAEIQKLCSQVSEWLASKTSPDTGEKIDLGTEPTPRVKEDELKLEIRLHPILEFLAFHELSQRFPDVLIMPEDYGMCFKISAQPAAAMNSSTKSRLHRNILESLQGFTRVLDLLISLKKPVVGHNLFSDLIMILKQFHGPLPPNFQDFKKELLQLFPVVYDTKFLSKELRKNIRRRFKRMKVWETQSLSGLYDQFQGFELWKRTKYTPNILPDVFFRDAGPLSERFHNAGWDSYCTGFIFIRMLHLFANLSDEGKEYEGKQLTSADHLAVAKRFQNHINMIHCAASYVVLDNADPSSLKAPRLYVQSKNGSELDCAKVMEWCSRYGSVHLTQIDKHSAMVILDARGTGVCLTIMRDSRRRGDFQVTTYSVIRHNSIVRFTLWGLAAVTIGASGCIIYKLLR